MQPGNEITKMFTIFLINEHNRIMDQIETPNRIANANFCLVLLLLLLFFTPKFSMHDTNHHIIS